MAVLPLCMRMQYPQRPEDVIMCSATVVTVFSCNMGIGNQIRGLWKSSWCSSLLRHLTSPTGAMIFVRFQDCDVMAVQTEKRVSNRLKFMSF